MKVLIYGDTSPRITIEVSKDVLELLDGALDSAIYEITPMQFRRDGYSVITSEELANSADMNEEELEVRAKVATLEELQAQLAKTSREVHMGANQILDDHGSRVGWDDASKLAIALEYIDNQGDDSAFEEFVRLKAEEDLTGPRYKHDCETCIFLGQFENCDLYYCPTSASSLVARWSNGSMLRSEAAVADNIPVIAEAKRRAIEKGLLTDELAGI